MIEQPINFQPRRPIRYRTHPTPPARTDVHVRVENSGDDGRFTWFFDRPFDDSGSGGWTAADFATLTLDGVAPTGMDEVIGADGDLTLLYPFATADSYAMLAQPPRLIFDVMPVALTPTTGPVE